MSEQNGFFDDDRDDDLDDEATLVNEGCVGTSPVYQPAISPSTDTPPSPVHRYHTHDLLAQGAMGRILLAQDRFLSRRVAFKEIRSELRGQAHILNGFLTEAQITAQLEHPGVIPVYTMEQHEDSSLAYTMKLVNGNTLKEELHQLKSDLDKGLSAAQWQQAYRRLVELFLVVCDTLDYAHNKGIVHRDLKPSNIMIGSYNEVYVLDWGIAARQDPPPSENTMQAVQLSLTPDTLPAGYIAGTPKYMSPEQAYGRPEALRATSDLFSLGLILYELTFLHQAFQGKDMKTLLHNVRHNQQVSEVPAFPQIKAPAEMVAIIRKATRRTISQRYASVAAMAQDIRAWLNDQPTQALPDTLPRKLLRWTRHHPQQSLALATVILLVSALGIALSLWWSQQAVQENRVRRQAVNQLFIATAIKASALDKQLGQFEALLNGLSAQGVEAFLRGAGPLPQRLSSLKTAFAHTHALALDPAVSPQSIIASGRLSHSPIRWSTLQYDNSAANAIPAPLIYPEQPGSEKETARAHFRQLSQHLQQSSSALKVSPQWGSLDTAYIPLYQGLYTASGQKLGWSGFLLGRQAIATLLEGSELPGLKQVWLINSGDPRQMLSLHPTAKGSPPPELLEVIAKKKSGYLEVDHNILAYQQLNTLPWHLVFQVEHAELWRAAADELNT